MINYPVIIKKGWLAREEGWLAGKSLREERELTVTIEKAVPIVSDVSYFSKFDLRLISLKSACRYV
jgi:hypothetical protein